MFGMSCIEMLPGEIEDVVACSHNWGWMLPGGFKVVGGNAVGSGMCCSECKIPAHFKAPEGSS